MSKLPVGRILKCEDANQKKERSITGGPATSVARSR